MFEDEIGTATFTPEPPEPYLFDVGDTIDGRYLVRAQLGNGGMGAVLRVEDQTTHETLALKYCKPNQNRRRFAREVRLMESIQSPYVIPISGSNLDHEPPYFVMPLAERSLETDLPSLVGDEATGLEIFRQVCLGVQDLHARGVFHRDLKPANVLRLPNGRMVVCDLGLARPENRDTTVLTRSIGWVGTEAYLAPEQRQPEGSRNSDARTDVYQLGKVLYQIVTGKHPRSVDYSKLPGGLDHIVKKATAEDAGDRYQSVANLEAALSAYRASKDPHQNPREVLEHLIVRIEGDYPNAVPPSAQLAQVLETLSHGGWLEHNLVIECFHRVPTGWLPSIARDHEPLLHAVLATYATAIGERVGGYNFDFADDVSERMKPIHDHSPAVRTKVLALRSLMTAADKLGRWKPQRTFCGYLEGIKTIDMALPVAEMITEFARPCVRDFQGFNMDMYHPAIQTALKGLRIRPFEEEEDLEGMEPP
jgi:eukaryotic-like serine/threonine-protein kinase